MTAPTNPHGRLVQAAQTAWTVFDMVCLALSPLAVLGFLVAVIILLDGFGSHVEFLQELEKNGAVATGRLEGFSASGKTAVVSFEEQNGLDGAVLYLHYYAPHTLAALKEGQNVSVRYLSKPSRFGNVGVLAGAYGEVEAYRGYISGVLWPLLACWLVAAVRPEVLCLGFDLPQDAQLQPRQVRSKTR